MKKTVLLAVTLLSVIGAFGQCPTTDFSINANACIDELVFPQNNTLGANQYLWDFCSGDFELTPGTERIGASSSLNRGRSVRVAQMVDENWIGFAIDQAANKLVRFEFDTSLDSTPTLTNLGNPSGLLSGAYDFQIVQEDNTWNMLVVNASSSNLIRYNFGTSLLNETPVAENLGDLGVLTTPNNITIEKSGESLYAFVTNGNGTIARLEFGNSILNTPSVSSFNITGINNPRGVDVIKDCDNWIGLVTSYSNNKVFYLDFGSDLSQDPASGEITFYTSYNYPASLSLIHEGGNYYGLIQSALGDLYKLSFGASIADQNGTGENLGDFGLNDNFANEWINIGSDWYGFSIELSNPATPGSGNLVRYKFPTTCVTSPSTSNEKYPQSEYTVDGNYQITLVAKNSNGDIDAYSQPITISPSHAPQLSAEITGNCLSSPINFSGDQLSGDITSWNWDFGDGIGTSSLQNDTYTYASAGDYPVKLTVTDANGCNNLYIDTARVYEEPIPDFSYPTGTLCMNLPTTFTNTTLGETGPAVSWTWDFNGEGSSNEKDPTFTFLTSGNKTVTLSSSVPGCANVTQQTIYIEEAPITDFGFDNVCNTLTTTFVNLTTGSPPVSWNWDFGDGNFSTDQIPTHTYTNPGKYAVSLSTANSLGCTIEKVDTVYNYAIPTVSFSNNLPCSTSPISFSDESMVQDGSIANWEWNFGDGNSSTERNPAHIYGQVDTFTVQLKAYSQYGCVDSTEALISLIQGPEVGFTFDKACSESVTEFTDTTNSRGIQKSQWTWSIDGEIYTIPNPEHTFTSAGIDTVQLSVTLSNNCSQTISRVINVEDLPIANFDYSESCKADTVTLFDITPGSIALREWWINGALESTDSAFNSSLEPGEYSLYLNVITENGCTDDIAKAINIKGPPEADFSILPAYGSNPLTVEFSNQSENADSLLWQFGDLSNTTSKETDPSFVYLDTGSYDVSLTAYGLEDCNHAITKTVSVVEPTHGAIVNSIHILEDGTIVVLLDNEGSITYNENNTSLVFTLDDGAEITEPLGNTLYPLQTISHVADFLLGEIRNSRVLCVSILYTDGDESLILDKNCITLNNQVEIIDAYPNPSSGFINIDLILPESAEVSITLIDSKGSVLYKNSYQTAHKGLHEYTIDTTPYRAGMYLLVVDSGDIRKVMKVVIDK
ncbi:MAG: PKD domain-containing protein [Bacteroidota bacterium]